MWKQNLGSNATYSNLISAFEGAGYKDYAEAVYRALKISHCGASAYTYSDVWCILCSLFKSMRTVYFAVIIMYKLYTAQCGQNYYCVHNHKIHSFISCASMTKSKEKVIGSITIVFEQATDTCVQYSTCACCLCCAIQYCRCCVIILYCCGIIMLSSKIFIYNCGCNKSACTVYTCPCRKVFKVKQKVWKLVKTIYYVASYPGVQRRGEKNAWVRGYILCEDD